MTPNVFLLLNLALAFYGAGAIWAHEVDIFRSWKLLDAVTFRRVQATHWRKLPYWVLAPVALTLAGSIALIWVHPARSPRWMAWAAASCQVSTHLLTAVVWGPWQAKLSRDERGPASPYLARILATHWLRTLLINLYAFLLLGWTIEVLA
jgi:hypothetical protein